MLSKEFQYEAKISRASKEILSTARKYCIDQGKSVCTKELWCTTQKYCVGQRIALCSKEYHCGQRITE